MSGKDQTLEIDGERFSTLEELDHEVSRIVIPGASWVRNLDAFNGILNGGFGNPDNGFRLVWRNSDRSRQVLGHDETARQLRLRLTWCHPLSRDHVATELAEAQVGRGPTTFDWIVEILRAHDDIELVLS